MPYTLKMRYKSLVLGLVVLASLPFALTARAATPILTVTSQGGDSVLLNITGDANSPVAFYYNVASSGGMQIRGLGNTSSGGVLSTTISTTSYGVNAGSLVYVIVNGQQSPMTTWPVVSGNGPTLSQTSLSLNAGQSTTVTSYGSASSLYVLTNSTPSVANFSASGTQVTVTANAYGSTTATVCYQGSSTNCASLYVTVQSGSGSGQLTFSQNNITLVAGQSLSVSVSGGNGSYAITSNSNQSAIQANINGSSINLYGLNAAGSANVLVCSNGTSLCGTLYVSVGSSSGSQITFSQNNLFFTSGQSQVITIYGGGGYTMSNNSNPTAVNVSLSGNSLTVYGVATGSANITICQQNSNICGYVYVTVNGSSGNSLTFSQSNPYLSSGQSQTVTIYGGTNSYFIQTNSNSSVAQLSLSGSTLTITGGTTGASTVTICATTSNCGSLYVTVGASSGSPITFSQSSPTVSMGQNLSVTVSGGSGSYYLPTVPTNIVQATVSGNIINLAGVNAGTGTLSVCSNGTSACGSLYVTVSSAVSNSPISFNPTSVSINVGQSTNVYLNGAGGYYLSGGQSTSIATMSLNGSTAIVTGMGPGSTNLTICQNGGQCSTLPVMVSGSGSGILSFSPASATLSIGQSQAVNISGSGNYYISGTQNTGIATASINGNILNVAAVGLGSTNLTICQNGGQCSVLYITVSSSGYQSGTPSFSQNNVSVAMGQNQMIALTGSGNYYLASNQNPGVAIVAVSTNSVLVNGVAPGSTSASICQNGGQCNTLYVTVTAAMTNPSISDLAQLQALQAQLAQLQALAAEQGGQNSGVSANFKFYRPLSYGMRHSDVAELQNRLRQEGIYSGPVTGFFGAQTMAALKQYQRLHGLSPLGSLGPGTRALLNR